MKKKIYLPKSAEELKKLGRKKQAELWARYCDSPYERQFRALWYYIACENANLKIERKFLTKLEKYAENPEGCMLHVYKTKYNLYTGTEIIKTFRNRQYKVLVADANDFIYDGKHYKSLSAVAKEICGIKVSGYNFFGLNNKSALKEAENGKN